MKVLFSPIGGTDPISMNNEHDGAMIHICREYKVDKVILYLSNEMLRKHQKDNRYIYTLEKLAEMQGRKIDYEIIERPELTQVQEFDYFYKDFRDIIEKILQSLSVHDELLLNISSGTPAMKSGIAVLKTLEEYPCKLIQVVTPVKKMNEHNHEGYDPELLWEFDQDNEPEHENRCREIADLPTLSRVKKEEMIKRHIETYDYAAALTVANTLSVPDRAGYDTMLRVAYDRLLLDRQAILQKMNGTEKGKCGKYFRQELEIATRLSPEDTDYQKCFEYALSLQVKLSREEYADFIRAITPLFVALLRIILREQCGIDVEQFCNNKGKWDRRKLQDTEVDRILNSTYATRFQYKDVYSTHLNALIGELASDEQLKTLSRALREVESKIRNMAAHEIVAVTDRDIEHKTGYTGEKIMEMIRQLFDYAGSKLDPRVWKSYDRMNAEIIKAI